MELKRKCSAIAITFAVCLPWSGNLSAQNSQTAQRSKTPSAEALMDFTLTVGGNKRECFQKLERFSGSFSFENGVIKLTMTDGMTLKGAPINKPGEAWDLRYGTDECQMRVFVGRSD